MSQQALARCRCEMSASASRRDDTDRSLARSAWESVPRKNRPVGYGMIGYEGQQREGLGQNAKQIQTLGWAKLFWPLRAQIAGLEPYGALSLEYKSVMRLMNVLYILN